jgi:hypothetical protein
MDELVQIQMLAVEGTGMDDTCDADRGSFHDRRIAWNERGEWEEFGSDEDDELPEPTMDWERK